MRQSPDKLVLPPSGRAGCLLCIEDNPVNGLLMQEFFGRLMGLEVVVATTGGEGLALLATLQPAALLLDLHLPDMDGLAVLSQLRQNPPTRDLPVVVVTGADEPELLARVKALQVHAIWHKPLDFKILQSMFASLLPEMVAAATAPRPA